MHLDAAAPSETTSTAEDTERQALRDLPVNFACKDKACWSCGSKSHEDSPFPDATPDDPFGGKTPWKRYSRSKCGCFKEPAARSCLLCSRAFDESDLRAKHGTWKNYRQAVKGRPEDHHENLLGRRKALIKRIIAQKHMPYYQCLEELSGSCRGRPTVTETVQQGCRQIQRRTFVTKSDFDVLYADTPTAARFGEQTHAVIDGEQKEGFWTRGDFHLELPGHHLFEDYMDTSTAINTVREDGTMVLSADQAQHKYRAIAGVLDESRRKSESTMAKLNASDMLQLIEQHGLSNASSSEKPAPASNAPEYGDTDGGDSERDNDDDPSKYDSDEDARRSCFLGLLSKHSTKSPAPKQAPSRGSMKKASVTAGSCGAKHASAGTAARGERDGKRPHHGIRNLTEDGRTKRLRVSLEKDLEEASADYQALIQEFPEAVDTTHALGKSTDYQNTLKSMSKRTHVLVNKYKAVSDRVQRSIAKENMNDVNEIATARSQTLKTAKKLMDFQVSGSAQVEDILEAVAELREGGVFTPSRTLEAYIWRCEAEQHLMFERFHDAIETLCRNCPQHRRLSTRGSTDSDCELIASTIAEGYILRGLTKLNQADLSKKAENSATRTSLISICNAFMARMENEDLLCGDVMRHVPTVKTLVNFENESLQELSVLVKQLQNPEEGNSPNPIEVHLREHQSGQLLLGTVSSYLEAHNPELTAQELKLQVLDATDAACATIMDDSQDGTAVEEAHAKVQELLGKMSACKSSKRMERDLRAIHNKKTHEAFVTVYKRRLEATAGQCFLWLQGKADDYLGGLAEAQDAKEDALKDVMDVSLLKLEAAAFRHTEELLTYACQQLRPTAASPCFTPDEAKSPWLLLSENKVSFAKRLQDRDRWKETVKCLLDRDAAPKAWAEGIGEHMKLYERLRDDIERIDQEQVDDIVAKLSSLDTLDSGSDMASQLGEIKNSIDTLEEAGKKGKLAAIVGLLEAAQQVKAGIDRGRMGAGLGRTPTLQRESARALMTLRSHMDHLKTEASMYICGGVEASAGPEPILQSIKFPLDTLKRLVTYSDSLIQSSATANQEGDLLDLANACKALRVLVEKVPDATTSEKKFRTHMSSNGTKLNDASKGVEKLTERVEKMITAGGLEVEVVDKSNTLGQAAELTSMVENLIALHTLITLVRNPAITNTTTSAELRGYLKAIVEEFTKPDTAFVCIESVLQEAKDILKTEEEGGQDLAGASRGGRSCGRGSGRGRGSPGAKRGRGRGR